MKKLLNNIGTKLISVLIAFLIWVVVVNGDDPEQTKAFSVKVTAENADSMLKAGKVYDVVSGDDTTVYVTARRSVLSYLSASDFFVTADLQSINNYTTVPSVPLVVSCTKRGVSIKQEAMRCEPASMKISIEDKVEKTFVMSVVTNGNAANGYELGSTKIIRGDTVVIAGSSSTLNKIDKVIVPVSLSGLSSSETLTQTMKIYDKNGDEMTNLDNLEIKTPDGAVLKDGQVKVKVNIWQVKNGISLKIGLVGEVAEGYHITAVTTTPETISLAGSANALKKLGGVLECEDAVNVSGISSSMEKSIEISDYLPSGESLKLEKDAASTVSVKVQVEKIDATTISKPISELNILGQPQNMDMVLTPGDKLSIEVQNPEGSTTILQTADIQATLDLTDYQKAGNYVVPVQIELPEGYSLVNDVTIVVNLEPKETESTTALETETGGNLDQTESTETESTTETAVLED